MSTTAPLYTASRQQVQGERSWIRSFFYDHPDYISRASAAYDGDKVKVWCKKCFEKRVADEIQSDSLRGNPRRSSEDIERALWALSKEASRSTRWIRSHIPEMLVHVRNCILQSPSDREEAGARHDGANLSPRRRQRAEARRNANTGPPPPFSIPADPALIVTAAAAAAAASANVFAPNPNIPQSMIPSSSRPASDLSPLVIPGSMLSMSTPAAPQHSPYSSSLPPVSASPSPSPSPSLAQGVLGLRRNSPVEFPSPVPFKRMRHGGRSLSRQSSLQPIASHPAWNEARQATFESRLARLTASCGWSLTWVENIEWIDFCADFIPQAIVPSHKVLGNRLIPAEVEKFRKSAQEACRGRLATLQCDGYTALNQHHLIAFMITVNGKVYTIRAYDTSNEPKTAENLLRRIYEVLRIVEQDWGVTVMALTSDCSGESRAARGALVRARKELVGPDCYAHQVDLVVRNYFGSKARLFTCTKQADELIKWLRSRTYLLALLRDIQDGLPGFSGPAKTVIRGVLTRWTSHYLAYHRLLELFSALQVLCHHPGLYESGDEDSHAKTRSMIPIIQDPLFWHSITRVKLHLEPLAVAANVTQSNSCRLDDVLITFGSLLQFFDSLNEPEETEIKEAVVRSLETRWSKADQDVFIAAVILNPFIRTRAFCTSPTLFSTAAIHALLERLWQRFYSSEPVPLTFYDTVSSYLHNTEEFIALPGTVQGIMQSAAAKNQQPDPKRVWQDLFLADQHESGSAF
ncbi:hypothetical protein BV20DRAFT_1007124, partial [Pilatotrama ljubarskyi]